MAALLPECEWYHIGSAPPTSRESLFPSSFSDLSPQSSEATSPQPIDLLPSTQALTPDKTTDLYICASLRQRLPPMPASLCPGHNASDASSITTAESTTCREQEPQDDPRVSCSVSDAGSARTPTQDRFRSLWEEQAATVDERHTQMFNSHCSFVRENLQAFSKEIVALREDLQVRAPMDAIQQVRLDLKQETATRCCVHERLERKMTEMEQVLTDDMRNVRETLLGMDRVLTDDMCNVRETLLGMDVAQIARETSCHEQCSLNVSLASEVPIFTDKLVTLEEKLEGLRRNCTIHLEERIAVESNNWVKKMAGVSDQLESLLSEVQREADCRVAGDKSSVLLISRTSEALKKALEQERQERQCMCSLVAEGSTKKVAVTKPDEGAKDLALNEALSGLFASVRSLQEAVSAEAELRVNSCEELDKAFHKELGALLEATKKEGSEGT